MRVWPGLLPIAVVAGVAVVVLVAGGWPLPTWRFLCCEHCKNPDIMLLIEGAALTVKEHHFAKILGGKNA